MDVSRKHGHRVASGPCRAHHQSIDTAPRGFTLIEVAIALAVLSTVAGGLLTVVMATSTAVADARRADVAQRAAAEKLEQLRSLSWTSDGGVVPVSDWSTDVARPPTAAVGGSGLGVSPVDTLASGVAGFSDVLDADGQWLAAGPGWSAGAAWERRWSVQAFSGLTDTLVFQVVVAPMGLTSAQATVAAARARNGTWLTGMRTRRAR